MSWVQLRSLTNADYVDWNILNLIVNDLYFLRAAIPEVYYRRPNKQVIFADGTTDVRLRIQSGVEAVPNFSGTHVFPVTLMKPNNVADYPIQLTLACNADIRVEVASQNASGFNYRVIPTSKSAMRGVKLHWMAITRE